MVSRGKAVLVSDVDIFKKSISIRYDIFENLYQYYIDIFKMLLFSKPMSCYEYLNKISKKFLALWKKNANVELLSDKTITR